jgi:hypothetical protein
MPKFIEFALWYQKAWRFCSPRKLLVCSVISSIWQSSNSAFWAMLSFSRLLSKTKFLYFQKSERNVNQGLWWGDGTSEVYVWERIPFRGWKKYYKWMHEMKQSILKFLKGRWWKLRRGLNFTKAYYMDVCNYHNNSISIWYF